MGRALDDACTHVGFFYVQNHGLAQEVVEGVLKEARRWFELPVSAGTLLPSACSIVVGAAGEG